MPPKEISLSQKLLGKAQEFAVQAGDKNLTGEKAIKSASRGIGTMLAQMEPESLRQEYSRIQQDALLTATQIAREKGAAAAAKFLLGHAVAASTLEDFAILKASEPIPEKFDEFIKKHGLIDEL